MKFTQCSITFLMGYFLYALIEIIARGYTHWTMALTGGAVFTTLCILFRYAPEMPEQCLYLLGAIVITSYELAVGVVVNLHFHWNVWDYSNLPLNYHGQICLVHSIFWYFTSIPAKYVYDRFAPEFFSD